MNIYIEFDHLLECGHVYVQMNRLLIKKEYIIVFVYITSTIRNHTVRVTPPKRIADQYTKAWSILFEPMPEGVVIKFIYSNHV